MVMKQSNAGCFDNVFIYISQIRQPFLRFSTSSYEALMSED